MDLPSNSGKYSDEVVAAYKKVKSSDTLGLLDEFITADPKAFERYTQILNNVSGFSDKLSLVVKNADSKTAAKIAEAASEYGEIVVDAVKKCDCESIYKITHYITESGVSSTTARKLFDALADHGDIMLKAIEKASPKNIDNVVDIISKVNRSQVDDVINLIARHGDGMVKAIKNCGADKTDLIFELAGTSKKVNWSDVLAIERMPDKIVWLEEGLDDAQALAKYVKEDFGRGFRHILEDHETDFLRQGISKNEIKDAIMKALRENNVVGKQGTRFVYFTNYKERDYVIAIEIGSNGFIVGANPKHLEDFIK